MNIKSISKIFAAIFGLSFILTSAQPVQAKNIETNVVANNVQSKELKSQISPGIYVDLEKLKNAKIINRKGTIYLEVKPIMEKLGYKVKDGKTNLTIDKNGEEIYIATGMNVYYVGYEKEKSVPNNKSICSVNQVIYAPKEFFEKEFDCKIKVVDVKETGYVGREPKVYSNNKEHYYIAPEKAVFIGKGLDTIKESNFDNLVPTNSDKIEIYKDGFVIKGEKIYLTPVNDAGIIYLPAEIVAEKMGALIGEDNRVLFGGMGHTPENVEITYNKKKLYFEEAWSCYKINNSSIRYLITKKDGPNLKKSPVLYRSIRGTILERPQFYVPINVFQREFNWKFEVKENIPMIPKPLNRDRGISEGWVCPQIKSKATNNFKKDLETLSKELEFEYEGDKTGEYNFVTFKAYPEYDPITSTFISANKSNGYYAILMRGYCGGTSDALNNEYLNKLEKVHPQLLKFFFPTKWQYIHNGIMKGNKNVYGKHKWDGREVRIRQGEEFLYIFFSKVGGKLNVKY